MAETPRKKRISIRRARASEIPACAVLYERVGRAAFIWRPKEYFERKNFLRHSLSEEIYVAVRGGKILGLLAFRRPENFIHHFYVARRAQGKGIGTRLLAFVRRKSKGPLELKVDAANKSASAFYESRGFRRAKGRDATGLDWGKRWWRYRLG